VAEVRFRPDTSVFSGMGSGRVLVVEVILFGLTHF